MYQEITKCRVCGGKELNSIMSLGTQYFTGVFPKNKQDEVMKGPVDLLKCVVPGGCGLVQLQQSYDINQMYGENYGYRSGLNESMVQHLHAKVEKILGYELLRDNDLIVDIGSNDATTLKAYGKGLYDLVGIDPTGSKFIKYYDDHINLISDFFAADIFKDHYGSRKARVITSFSMFYDLEDPVSFAKDIEAILEDGGIWVFEQSYMPTMLEKNSFDTICHEHLLFYSLKQIIWILDKASLRVIDVEFNDVNGGSFSVVAAKRSSKLKNNAENIDRILKFEESLGLSGTTVYEEFVKRVDQSCADLLNFINQAQKEGKRIAGLGASTKGNVLLQYYGINPEMIYAVGEVNEDKFGSYTPGSLIPIISEQELLSSEPDYIIVLPWHFRKFFENLPSLKGQSLVFPLPKLKIVNL
jgi:hypothetical protein